GRVAGSLYMLSEHSAPALSIEPPVRVGVSCHSYGIGRAMLRFRSANVITAMQLGQSSGNVEAQARSLLREQHLVQWYWPPGLGDLFGSHAAPLIDNRQADVVCDNRGLQMNCAAGARISEGIVQQLFRDLLEGIRRNSR